MLYFECNGWHRGTFIWKNDKDSEINVTPSDDKGPYDLQQISITPA